MPGIPCVFWCMCLLYGILIVQKSLQEIFYFSLHFSRNNKVLNLGLLEPYSLRRLTRESARRPAPCWSETNCLTNKVQIPMQMAMPQILPMIAPLFTQPSGRGAVRADSFRKNHQDEHRFCVMNCAKMIQIPLLCLCLTRPRRQPKKIVFENFGGRT